MSVGDRVVAERALGRFGVVPRRLTRVARSFNSVFAVQPRGGSRVALRVGARLRIHAAGAEIAETNWLAELWADGLPVPSVHRSKRGARVVRVDDVQGRPRPCTLCEWLDGPALASELREPEVRATGRLAALIHAQQAGRRVEPPPGVLVADRVLYWRIPDRLNELQNDYGDLFEEALARSNEVIDEMWQLPPHPPHLLHGDLTPRNVILTEHGPAAIDFQDLIWGFEVQDVAISVGALRDRALVAAFRAGYESIRPWSVLDVPAFESLIAGRYLHQLNLGLNVRGPGLPRFTARIAADLARWMRGGSVLG